MPYQAKEAIYSDTNPLARKFTGRIFGEGDANANFVVVGKGGVLSDADVEKFGLTNSSQVEKYDEKEAAQKREAASLATHGIVVPQPDVKQAKNESDENPTEAKPVDSKAKATSVK